MLILIPPSEGKSKIESSGILFEDTDFVFKDEVLEIIKLLSLTKNQKIQSIYGTSREKSELCHKQNLNISKNKCAWAIERYTGVLFSHIDWNSLDKESQNYMEQHVRIFSGLFGFLTPKTLIPNYKLKMNALSLDKYWNPILTKELENNDMILDLLPQIHRKAYRPNQNVIKIDFFHLKQGKTNSAGHLGKSVKGEFIRYLAKNQIKNIKDFQLFEFDGFHWNQGNFVKEIA